MGSVGRKFRWATCAAMLALGVGAAAARGADAPTTDPSDLTNLSLEDLMNLEVTSVSKHRQKVSEAPAAVTVNSTRISFHKDCRHPCLMLCTSKAQATPKTDITQMGRKRSSLAVGPKQTRTRPAV